MSEPGLRRVIGAVARRDLRIQLTYRFDIVSQAEAVVFRVAFTVFLARLVPDDRLGPYSGGYFEWALIGFAAVIVANIGLKAFTQSITTAQAEGTLELMLVTPARISALLLGTLAVPLAVGALEVGATFGLGGAVGADLQWSGAAMAFPVFILMLASFGALGVLSAALLVLTKRGGMATTLLTQAATFLGGAVFPVSLLPSWLQTLAKLMPSYYGLNGLREALIGGAKASDVLPDIAALLAFTLILGPIAVWCFSRALRAARVAGTLGTY